MSNMGRIICEEMDKNCLVLKDDQGSAQLFKDGLRKGGVQLADSTSLLVNSHQFDMELVGHRGEVPPAE